MHCLIDWLMDWLKLSYKLKDSITEHNPRINQSPLNCSLAWTKPPPYLALTYVASIQPPNTETLGQLDVFLAMYHSEVSHPKGSQFLLSHT